MENKYRYFNRDISWLSFNYRVLLEAEDQSLPVFERIKFLAIHASNLEEFYKIRVAEHRAAIFGNKFHSMETGFETTEELLIQINQEAIRQQDEASRIFNQLLIPELANKNIILYKDQHTEPFHREFIRHFFEEEIFPFLQPVMIAKDEIRMFLRDNRLYTFVRLIKNGRYFYSIIKVPYSKVSRFITLPPYNGNYYMMFVEDIIAANLESIFPGFMIDQSFSIKISRDADIFVEEDNPELLAQDIIKKVKKRKLGDLSRFVYDREMPQEILDYLCDTFGFHADDLVPGGKHLNLEDLIKLPNPVGSSLTVIPPIPLRIKELDNARSFLSAIYHKDILLYYPYQSFDYLLRFLKEAAFHPEVEEIKLTQYRVAENSAVIDNLILAAKHGKKVTVFVELKARFDEENNWHTAELMKQVGIRIIYSLPKLKVHAKLALIKKRKFLRNKDLAYLSTGNFNEKTAELYADMGLFTANKDITQEIAQVFNFLEQQIEPNFRHLLVSQFNMVPSLISMIDREIQHVNAGKRGYIILKMNGIQDERMIGELYKASEAGVEIDLIIRGVCCAIPNQPFSKNIRITRIVDMFLEHSRIWYFYNSGEEQVYLSSADWLKRNLNRRVEAAFPLLSVQLKQEVISILHLQLSDNVKACWVDEELRNVRKTQETDSAPIRSQKEVFAKIENP